MDVGSSAWAARADRVGVVDAPVTGGPHNAAAGSLTPFVGETDEQIGPFRHAIKHLPLALQSSIPS